MLEDKADELTMSCLCVKNCNIPKMMETLMTQFSLGVDNFPRTLEASCSIHSTAFRKKPKQPDKGGTDDDDGNDNGNKGGKGIIGTHLTMDEDDEWYQDEDLIS